MFLHNRYGVLILGALTGAALNFGRLMSEAFILSKYPPWVALVVAGVGSLLFSVMLQKYDWERRKFATTATIATLGFAGAIAALATGSGFADVQALIQEVVSAVNREMELRRERRQEDNHEPWW